MGDVILKIENVSKLYRLGTVGTGTFGGDVQRFWKTKILGQEDPFLKIGQINDRTSKEKAEFVWALQDINFEVKRGEILGIIGKNGAGKSTLLKLLSRITTPTTGTIKSAGRMASLLEVGTGFHPELTGRENIFLNGAILGMTKKEIQSKFDEIVDFSGCELYIDTPTKRYSSGMTVRLGFAVAAFLDPEILVVDEVLAVGDAEFQKKAIGKMQDVSQGEGKTILFVSHNMQSVKKLTSSCLLLFNGGVKTIGPTYEVIDQYLSQKNPTTKSYCRKSISKTSCVKEVYLENPRNIYDINDDIDIIIKYECINSEQKLSLSLALFDNDEHYILNSPSGTTDKIWSFKQHEIGHYQAIVSIKGGILNKGNYNVSIILVENGISIIEEIKEAVQFEVDDKTVELGFTGFWGGLVRPKLDWNIQFKGNDL